MQRRYKLSADQDASKKRTTLAITAISAAAVLAIIIVSFSLAPTQTPAPDVDRVQAPEVKEQPKGFVSTDMKAINFESFSDGINLMTYSSRFASSRGDSFNTRLNQATGKVTGVTEFSEEGSLLVTCPVAGKIGDSIFISGIWLADAVGSVIIIQSESGHQMGMVGQYNKNFVYQTSQLTALSTPSAGEAYTITFTLVDETTTEVSITHGTTTKSIKLPYYLPNLPTGFVPSIKRLSMSSFGDGVAFMFTSISTSWESGIGNILYY